MLDLNKYINNSEEVKIGNEIIHVLEPSLCMLEKISEIEKDMTEENIHQKRVDVALVMLNHNKEGKQFVENEVKSLPLEAIVEFITRIGSMRVKADADPN